MEMEAKTGEKVDVKRIIEAMEVGDEQRFAIRLLSNIRAYASNAGLRLGRQYKTFTDRESMEIVVAREA